MKAWRDPQPVTVPATLAHDIGGHPLIAETLVRRGFTTSAAALAFMNWHHYTPTSAYDLPDMDKAVERVRRAIQQREIICVWGDFDVDGQTATALLASALRDLGANVVSYIPQRLTEGHGVHIPSLKQQIDGGARLILTCDTGIDEHEAVDYARTRDVDVVITDHHKLPDDLPKAVAAVNSRRVPPGHPLRDLPGVGVAYKLVEALAPDRDWTHLLDLVALGIVADVAMQCKDTRHLLQRGLAQLRGTQRLGLQVMMDLAEVNPMNITEDDIGFRLAPRLNAIGRLGDANPTTELLTTANKERARIIANQLEGLNAERRRLTDDVWRGVQAEVERDHSLLKHAALVVAHPEWHTGVVGIVANRCVEAYNRPALLLKAAPEAMARGSARSIAGVDITDAIAANAHLLRGYGGHTMAAGVELDTDHIDDFRRGLSASVRQQLANVDDTPTLHIDGYMALGDLTLPFAQDVARIAPFGAGNPPLVLASTGLMIKNTRQLGRTTEHLKLTVEDDAGTSCDVVWWGAEEPPAGRFDLAYTVRVNTFRGVREVQIEWLDYRQQQADVIEVAAAKRENITFIDHRHAPDPLKVARSIMADEGDKLLVWAEVNTPPNLPSATRVDLTPGTALLALTAPPDAATWASVLDAVGPACVYLVGHDPGMDEPQTFLKRLAGLVKYTIKHKGGTVQLDELAAMTAQRPETTRAGLDWLAARGQIAFADPDGGVVALSVGGTATDVGPVTARLKRLLDESAAYRAYWRRAHPDSLRG